MILEISIKNIALIDELIIEFGEGFNVLTGETGAGKSIIIDSVNLALGERADRELIQTGKDFARVEMLFSLDDTSNKIKEILADMGIPLEEDGSLLIMREITLQGRNLCKVNGRTVTLSMLREISSHLVDIHGQHQHQSLLNPDSHIELLDKLGGIELEKQKSKVQDVWSALQTVNKEIIKLQNWNKDGERRKDILRYQIEEIYNASLQPGEEEEIRRERAILINAEKIANAVASSYYELYSGDANSVSIIDKLSKIISQLEEIEGIDDSLDSILEGLRSILYTLEDLSHELRSYRDNFDFDPGRLAELENRLEQIFSLKRKYGNTIEEILNLKESLEKELNVLENSQERLDELITTYNKLYKLVIERCSKLSEMRKKCALLLEQRLANELADLNMNRANFVVSITSPEFANEDSTDIKGITRNGFDTVNFLISTNAGEPLKPLEKIVSGGEMSRLMLAFKTILGDLDEIPTMIFDEIDVGISGRTAQKVAEKICFISRNRQVICVTHLPQIAAMADKHFAIEKLEADGRTRTVVNKLNYNERKKEIARLIGGTLLTPLSLEHADELIKSALLIKENHK